MKHQRNNLNKNLRIVIIDNYDSFTYNLVQYFGIHTESVFVFKNDLVTLREIEQLSPTHIILSPGPGTPKSAGISKKVVQAFYNRIPILGVCLGHQCIANVFGATIIHAPSLYHGKTSLIEHNGQDIFTAVKNPFLATRYHSLLVSSRKFPAVLEITAFTDENIVLETQKIKSKNKRRDKENIMSRKIIMAIQHKKFPVFGVQFHPESILTTEGMKILANFLAITLKK